MWNLDFFKKRKEKRRRGVMGERNSGMREGDKRM
jgi:hypothetical protein